MVRLLIARIDRLLAMGALDQAQALIDAAGPAMPRPSCSAAPFDVALLTGQEDAACDVLQDLARACADGDDAGVLPGAIGRLERRGADACARRRRLGNVSETEDHLLSRFLDPDLFDGEAVPPPPNPVTPLIWRIYDALGEPLPTATLPLAFAHADLSDRAGWKAQIEAAERLARAGVISPNVLAWALHRPCSRGLGWGVGPRRCLSAV